MSQPLVNALISNHPWTTSLLLLSYDNDMAFLLMISFWSRSILSVSLPTGMSVWRALPIGCGLAMIVLLAGMSGCQRRVEPSAATMTLATTTSTRDSGLLEQLLPIFHAKTGIEVKVVAVGSGQALELGRRGDADVLLSHAPDAEASFLAEGAGIERQPIMHNDFILVGPPRDPAEVRGMEDIVAALRQITDRDCLFLSRGDESGTHQRERLLWKEVVILPDSNHYLEVGSGMAATLRMASEKAAYTLTDRGTFLAQRDALQLELLVAGDVRLRNQYAVILVNPVRHPHVKINAARQFAAFLLSNETQEVIGEFGRDRWGEPLFFPERQTTSVGRESL